MVNFFKKFKSKCQLVVQSSSSETLDTYNNESSIEKRILIGDRGTESTDEETSNNRSYMTRSSWETESICSIETYTVDSTVDSLSTKSISSSTSNRYKNYLNDKENLKKELRAIHSEACSYLRDGELDKAKENFEKLLAKLVKNFGEKNQQVGAALHNIGIVHLRSKNLTDAVDAIEEAVKIRKAALGNYHPKVSDSLVELGIMLLSLDHIDDSLKIFNEALEIRERQLEIESKNSRQMNVITQQQIAKIHNNIGCAYYECGDMDIAMDEFDETLEFLEKVIYRKNHRPTLPEKLGISSIIHNIGQVHLERQEWQNATAAFEEVLKIQEDVFADTPEAQNDILLNTRENLAYATVKLGSYDKAQKVYHDILEVHERNRNDKAIVSTLRKIAYTQIKLFEYDEGLETLEDIRDIEKHSLSSNNQELKKLKNLILTVQDEARKLPDPNEAVVRTLANLGFRNPLNDGILCKCAVNDSDIDLRECIPLRPPGGIKLSGHKISFS